MRVREMTSRVRFRFVPFRFVHLNKTSYELTRAVIEINVWHKARHKAAELGCYTRRITNLICILVGSVGS